MAGNRFDGYATRSVLLPDSPLAARKARQVISELLRECGADGCGGADTAVLLTSEAVTNAFQHAAPEARGARAFRLRVSVLDRGATVHIEVSDPDPGIPIAQDADDDFAEQGRGVRLIEQQAAKHGVGLEEDGKTVWFDVNLGDDSD